MNRAQTAMQDMPARQPCLPLLDPGAIDAQLAQVFDSASRAPGHGNSRPWEFVFVRGEARGLLAGMLVEAARKRMPEAPDTALRSYGARARLAPLVIALGANARIQREVPEAEQMLAAGAVAMNVINSVHTLGYGAFWAAGVQQVDDHLVAALGFREQVRLAGFVFVGSPGRAGISSRRAHCRAGG